MTVKLPTDDQTSSRMTPYDPLLALKLIQILFLLH